jgi:hypothetical protein
LLLWTWLFINSEESLTDVLQFSNTCTRIIFIDAIASTTKRSHKRFSREMNMSSPVGIQNPVTTIKAWQNIRDCGEDVEQEIEYFLETHAGRYQRDQMASDLALLVRRAFGNGATSAKN